MKKWIPGILAALLLLPLSASGQSKAFQMKGFVQTWISAAQADGDWSLGFSQRRARLKAYGDLNDKISCSVYVKWDKQAAGILDAYLEYAHSAALVFRAGQFIAPGARYSPLFPVTRLDFVERPLVTQMWGSHTGLASYRNTGIQLHGRLHGGRVYYAVMAANQKGAGTYSPSVKAVANSGNDAPLLVGRVEVEAAKGLTMGCFGANGDESSTGTQRRSYGAHLFYQHGGLNFKSEWLQGRVETDGAETVYSGWFVLMGYRKGAVEPLIRVDGYEPNDGLADVNEVEYYLNVTGGVNWYAAEAVKLQVNYVHRSETMVSDLKNLENDIFYMNIQVSFATPKVK